MLHIYYETREAYGTNHDLNGIRMLVLYYILPLWFHSVMSLKSCRKLIWDNKMNK